MTVPIPHLGPTASQELSSLPTNCPTPLPRSLGEWGRAVGGPHVAPLPALSGGAKPSRHARLRHRIASQSCHPGGAQPCPRRRTPRLTGVNAPICGIRVPVRGPLRRTPRGFQLRLIVSEAGADTRCVLPTGTGTGGRGHAGSWRPPLSRPSLSVIRSIGPRVFRSMPPRARRRDVIYLPLLASLCPVFRPGLSRVR